MHIFETDSLESIEYKEASGEEMSFVKEDDTWEYAPDTTIALTESSMQNMEDAFSDIQAVKEIKNPDDLSDYGFDSPEYNLTLTGKDGEAHKFLIGNASGENYYFMEDGTEKVYTVSADLISEMVWQLADVAEKDSFVTVTSDNFVKETVTKPGDEVKTYEADNEDQEDTVTSIMTALSGFYFTDCADYHVTDATLGNYGLAEDQRTKVELTYKEYELLKLLMTNAGIVTTRELILDRVWGIDFEGESRTLDMHIKTLRQKLKEEGSLIKTVRNVGYIMNGEKA